MEGAYGSAPKPIGTESWTTGVRLTWSRWPAQPRRGMTTGPCEGGLGVGVLHVPTGVRQGSKKRSQAEERVVHPQGPDFDMEEVWTYTSPYDPRRPVVCFGPPPSCWPRRGHLCRPGPEFRCGRTTSIGGAHGTVPDLPGRVAARGGDSTAHGRTLRWRWWTSIRRSRWSSVGPGQLEHSPHGVAVRAFPAAEARRIAKRLEFHYGELVEYGGNRVQRTGPSDSDSPTRKLSGGRSRPWLRSATPPKPPSTGASTPMTPEPNCTASIPLIPNMTEY